MRLISTPIVRRRRRSWFVRRAVFLATLAVAGGLLTSRAPAQPVPAVPAAGLPAAALTAEQLDANRAVAMRLSTAAFEVLQSDQNARLGAAWRQAIAYLEAAGQLDPAEPRYPKLRAEACQQINDVEGNIAALEQYLAIDGSDETARLRLIERYTARMQTTDAKLGYLQALLGKASISKEIKSRCAVWAAILLMERSHSQATEMVAKAVELDPVNIYARRLEFQLLATDVAPDVRMKSLLAQLRCNPAQVRVLATIGHELALQGMVRESIDWYAAAANLSVQTGQSLDAGFFVEYAAELFMNGMFQTADDIVGHILEAQPTNLDARFLRLIVRRSSGQRLAYEQELEAARRIFQAHASVVTARLLRELPPSGATTRPAEGPGTPTAGAAPAGTPPAGTRPANTRRAVGSSLPRALDDVQIGPDGIDPRDANGPSSTDLDEAVARATGPDATPEMRAEFVSVITDLAWFEIYFARSEGGAEAWLEAVKKMLPADNSTVVRLQGWFEYLSRKDTDAMKTLWTVRDRDTLAAMGVAELLTKGNWGAPAGTSTTAPASRPAGLDPDIQIRKLIDQHPVGLMGAMLAGNFKDRKAVPQPLAFGEKLRKLVLDFPQELIRVVDRPEKFYTITGEALKVPYRLGEPMIARVTLRNLNNYDLPIGPDGIIKPDLWFDSRVGNGVDKNFPMSGNERVTGQLVLKAQSSVSLLVRIDQGPLGEALRERPAGSVDVYMTAMTNPMITSGYRVLAGPSGVRKPFVRSLVRGGVPVQTDAQRKQLFDGLAGVPSDRLWTLDVLSALVEEGRRNPGTDPKKAIPVAEMTAQIHRGEIDRMPQVAGWAVFQSVRLADVADRSKLVGTMAGSPSWEVRLFALWASRRLSTEDRIAVAKLLSADANEFVKRVAEAEVEIATRPPDTQPTTGPATAPAVP